MFTIAKIAVLTLLCRMATTYAMEQDINNNNNNAGNRKTIALTNEQLIKEMDRKATHAINKKLRKIRKKIVVDARNIYVRRKEEHERDNGFVCELCPASERTYPLTHEGYQQAIYHVYEAHRKVSK